MPTHIRKYFWDADVNGLEINKYSEYIIARILEHGDIKATQWMFKNFHPTLIKRVFLKRRGFSPKTTNFWRLFFNISKKELCLRKSCKKTPNALWPY